jgi:hypothetical protein
MFRKYVQKMVENAIAAYEQQHVKPLVAAVSALRGRLDEINELAMGTEGRLTKLEAAYDEYNSSWSEEDARAEKDFIEGLANLVNFDVKKGEQ